MTTPYYEDATVQLHHGDCLDVLRGLPDNSVDSVVTDPPYGLEFMGKEWDAPWKEDRSLWTDAKVSKPEGRVGSDGVKRNKTAPVSATTPMPTFRAGLPFQQWCLIWAIECLRVLKPGGHLLAFGGTRTWHRLACAVEDAGFEVRDSIAWLYGSGFPKSLDVSKAIDKAAGAEREVGPIDPSRAGRLINQAGDYTTESGWSAGGRRVTLDPPATPDAERWQGWGTALKPAFEPVVVARKPLSGTVASNVLAWGTGALNVDGCRIGDEPAFTDRPGRKSVGGLMNKVEESRTTSGGAGRWPANVVLDESQAAELDQMSGVQRDGTAVQRNGGGRRIGSTVYSGSNDGAAVPDEGYGGEGGASRFFYVAKADAGERVRVAGVAHPTVKPLALMRWLVRLVTPPGGVVLEPFAGSGTTVEACILEGFHCLAIEREADYLPLIVQRINRRRDPVAAVIAQGDDAGLFDLLDGEPA